jgi:hypothetical protein
MNGVINIMNEYGATAEPTISEHPLISRKVGNRPQSGPFTVSSLHITLLSTHHRLASLTIKIALQVPVFLFKRAYQVPGSVRCSP